MAKTRFIQNAFTSGVLSPLLKGRTDLTQYYQSLETAQNWVLLPQGGIKRRPGTQYIDLAPPVLTRNAVLPTMPNGGTAANINDGSDVTAATTTTNISTVDPYIIAKTDLGVATYIDVADIRGIFLSASGSTSELVIQHSDDDITYTTGAVVPLVGVASQNFRLFLGVTKRYFQLVRVGATDLGTNKFTLSEFNLWQKSATLSEVKLKDFSVETDRHYLLAFTEGNCRIYRKNTNIHVADIKMPYLSADVLSLRDTQSEQVMLTFHEDYATQRIINLGTDTDWALDDAPFTNIPQYDYDDDTSPTPTSDVQVLTFTAFVAGDTFQLDIEGVLSKNITFAGDATAAEQTATAFNIQKNIQDMPVVGDTGVSVARTGPLAYTITISGESTKAFKLFSGFATTGTASKTIAVAHSVTGVPRKEDVWSSIRGYPKSACYYGGRLVLGGTKSKPQSVFMSKAGSAFNFDIDEGDPDDAIFNTISSRKLNNIVDVFPSRNLQIFTDGSEFTVNTSPITPETFAITPQTSHGSLNLEAKDIDGATIFADRNGKSIKEYVFSFQEDAYTTNDISVLSPELIKSPVDIAILGGTSSDDANWVFIVNNDGSATILNTLRAQDINGFTEWTTTGFITNVSVVDDDLYMVNKRTINGVLGYYIERWSFDHLLDCSVKTTNIAPLGLVAGYNHLIGETVRINADGSVLQDRVVNGSGELVLTTDEETHVSFEAGISFIPTLKPMPINTNIGSGPNAMRLKKLVRINVRVLNTSGLYIEGLPIAVRQFSEAATTPLDSPPLIKTGIIGDFLSTIGWSREEMPVFTVPDPTPCTILNIEYEVESS
jgi:hypothetical protein